jgi:hypothetical protein
MEFMQQKLTQKIKIIMINDEIKIHEMRPAYSRHDKVYTSVDCVPYISLKLWYDY